MADARDLLVLREQQWREWFPPTESVEAQLDGFIKFCTEAVFIRHPKGRRLFALRPAQVETARNLIADNSLIVLKARQIGFSTLIAVYSLWRSLGWRDHQTLLLSKGEREAQVLLSHAIYAYDNFPEWIKKRGPERKTDNILKQEWRNGSVITSLPSKKDAARGYTGTLLVADEFAFLENPEEAWSSMLPAADIGGQIMVLTTANGAGTLFEDLWNNSYTGASTKLKPLFWSWREVSERDDEWYEEQKNTMQTHLLHQEYPNSPEEAFVKSGRSVFDLDRLSQMETLQADRGFMLAGKFHSQDDGELWVWEYPREDYEYVMGIDIAEGLDHGDASAAFVFNVRTEEVVAHIHCHQPVDAFAMNCMEIAKWYNTAILCPESNNHGAAFIYVLTQKKYPRIYKQRHYGRRRQTKSELLGYRTTQASKPLLIDGLYTFLRHHNVPHVFTVRELRTYVRDENGKMSGSPHDDRVMALALTVEMLKYAHAEEYKMALVPKKGTLAYYEAQWDKESGRKGGLHKHLVRTG